MRQPKTGIRAKLLASMMTSPSLFSHGVALHCLDICLRFNPRCDRENGLGGIIASQIVPFGDAAVMVSSLNIHTAPRLMFVDRVFGGVWKPAYTRHCKTRSEVDECLRFKSCGKSTVPAVVIDSRFCIHLSFNLNLRNSYEACCRNSDKLTGHPRHRELKPSESW